jgi:hypothetical protein
MSCHLDLVATYNQSLHDKDPTPAHEAACWTNGREATGQEAAESARERSGSVEDANAESQLAARVHAGQIQDHAREKATFKETENGS